MSILQTKTTQPTLSAHLSNVIAMVEADVGGNPVNPTNSSAGLGNGMGLGFGLNMGLGLGSIQVKPGQGHYDEEQIYNWILDLIAPETRANAMQELSKKRELVTDMAPMLWHSFGTMAVLIQEVVSVYPAISPPTLTAMQSNRVCNALALLQCIASHPDTKPFFIEANILMFLYPFLHTTSTSRPFEYIRLTSLGVIGALVKTDEGDAVSFLLTTEIIPLSLRIMETGQELSKTVATFVLQKILVDEAGLVYICSTYDRFSHVAMILGQMVIALAKKPSGRLLKHVIRCYLRLSENQRAREALRQCLPDVLKNGSFDAYLMKDELTKNALNALLENLDSNKNGSAATLANGN